MKITSFKIPVTLKRDSQGEVTLKIHDADKTLLKEEETSSDNSEIVNLSKKLADYNEQQKALIVGTMFAGQTEEKSFITFKYLTE